MLKMKRHELLFWTIKLPLEFLIMYSSFFVARNFRLVSDFIPWVHLPIKTIEDSYLSYYAFFWAILFVVVLWLSGLYRIQSTYSRAKQFFGILKWSLHWFLLYISILYLANWYLYNVEKHVEIPRLIILFTLILSVLFVVLERFLMDSVQRNLLEDWRLQKTRIALITDSDSTDVIEEIARNGLYDIVGYFNSEDSHLWISYLWGAKKFPKMAEARAFDELLYVSWSFLDSEIDMMFEYSRIYWIRYKYVANSFDFTKNNIEATFLWKIPVVEIKSIWLWPWERVLKRIADILVSFFGIIALSPLLIVVGILIKKEDPKWPVIFKNKRVGKDWQLFDLFKFRYMKWEYCVKDAYGIKPDEDEALKFEKELIKEKSERDGPLYKIIDDPRKTKIWALIEKYSIDELPQLFNVFLWSMSLVGPRPHQPREVDMYKEYQKRVLTLKPWITWMAQTHGRHKNSFDDEVKLDIFYIENYSLLLDLKIIFKTFKVILER